MTMIQTLHILHLASRALEANSNVSAHMLMSSVSSLSHHDDHMLQSSFDSNIRFPIGVGMC